MPTYRIEHYCAPSGSDVFGEWFDRLRDQQTRARVSARIDRLALGLAGDAKTLRESASYASITVPAIACTSRARDVP